MTDTITACSTPLPGAVAIIRISGAKAKQLLQLCFKSPHAIKNGVQRYGILCTDDIKDTAMAVYFSAPKTYTGEDTAEIYTHGSKAVVESALRFLIKNGARLANGGEFTKRAYLNGKLDLSAAEGVINLINAETQKQAGAAFMMLNGDLKKQIDDIQARLMQAAAATEVAIDYPEEGIEEETKQQTKTRLTAINNTLKKIKDSYNSGRLIKNGVKVALMGKVNAGKSQLSNALLGKDMSIVTDIAGTTRDTLRDFYQYNGYRFVISDTAGIRQTDDKIELMGIERAIKEIIESDIILMVYEEEYPIDFEIFEIIKQKTGQNPFDKQILFVQNKLDIKKETRPITDEFISSLPAEIKNNKNIADGIKNSVRVSALMGINIQELKEKILSMAQITATDGIMLTESRHYHWVVRATEALDEAINNIDMVTLDCIASDILTAYNSLGQITGIIGTEEIIDHVFKNFCVGK